MKPLWIWLFGGAVLGAAFGLWRNPNALTQDFPTLLATCGPPMLGGALFGHIGWMLTSRRGRK